VLYELAAGLFGSAENPFPAFRIERLELLESALALPHQPYYETFFDKLAALVRSIAANHSLVDGNKRLAVAVLHSTLLVNGFIYVWDQEDAAEIALRCAQGETDFRWLSAFIEAWTGRGVPPVPIERTAIVAAIGALRAAAEDAFADDIDQTTQAMMRLHARGALDAAVIDRLLAGRRLIESGSFLDEPR